MLHPLTSRRKILKQLAAGTLATAVVPFQACATETMKEKELKGNINHSVCAWTLGQLSLDELCIEVKKLGLKAIDLVAPKDWPILQKAWYSLFNVLHRRRNKSYRRLE